MAMLKVENLSIKYGSIEAVKNVSFEAVSYTHLMLATGGSAILAVDSLKKRGAANIKFVCLVAAPEGCLLYTSRCV